MFITFTCAPEIAAGDTLVLGFNICKSISIGKTWAGIEEERLWKVVSIESEAKANEIYCIGEAIRSIVVLSSNLFWVLIFVKIQ